MPKFKTKLHQQEGMNATGIVVPAKTVEALGAGKTPPVNVTINGKYTYRGRIASMGGEFMIGVAKEHREKAGIKGGDSIEVEITLDDAPREVAIPPELAKALARRRAQERRLMRSPTQRVRSMRAPSKAPKPRRRVRDASPRSLMAWAEQAPRALQNSGASAKRSRQGFAGGDDVHQIIGGRGARHDAFVRVRNGRRSARQS